MSFRCNIFLVTIVFGCGLAAPCSVAEGRIWTDRSGKYTIEAELLTVRKGVAYLESDTGEVKKIPLTRLSVEDLQHLASLPGYGDEVAPLLPAPKAPAATAKRKMARIESQVTSGSIRQFRSASWGYDAVVFGADGGQVIALGNDNLTVVEVNTTEPTIYEFGDSLNMPSCLAISPDGKHILAGDWDGVVAHWLFDKGKLSPKQRFPISEKEVKSISISPDSRLVLSTNSDGEAFLWELETGKKLGSYSDLESFGVLTSAFSRRGGQALVTDGGLLALVDCRSQKLMQAMSVGPRYGRPNSVAFSHDRNNIALADGRTIAIWEIRTGKQLPPISVPGIQWSAAFTTNDAMLITGGSGVVNVWDVENGTRVEEFRLADSGYVKHIAVSPDGLHFAAIGDPIGKLVEVFRLPTDRAK